jgi:PPOX class probable F420-dependent enzyme
MVTLTDKVRMLFDGRNFAVLSTLEPDGKPHSTVVWAKADGDHILFALPKSRRKTANLSRDPRATVVIFDAANPYESAQVQGTASIEDDPTGMLVDDLAQVHGRAISRVRRAEPAMGDREDHGRKGHHQLAQLMSPRCAAHGRRAGRPARPSSTPTTAP